MTEVRKENITKEEFALEIRAMLATCFEGEVRGQDTITITFQNGQRFTLYVQEQ